MRRSSARAMRRGGARLLNPWNGLGIAIMGVPRGPLRPTWRQAVWPGAAIRQHRVARPQLQLWPDRLSSFDPAFFIPDGSSPDPALSRCAGAIYLTLSNPGDVHDARPVQVHRRQSAMRCRRSLGPAIRCPRWGGPRFAVRAGLSLDLDLATTRFT